MKYKCQICNMSFIDYIPYNGELVQFECDDKKKRYLPVYGKNGYLDLFKKLIDGWSDDKSITEKDTKLFEHKLSEICPYRVALYFKARCPYCSSYKILILQEMIRDNFPVDWIEIQFMKSADVAKAGAGSG